MEDRYIVDILNVTFSKVGVDAELFTQEMQSIQRFGLSLGDGWDLRVSRKMTKANKVSSAILKRDPLRCRIRGRMMEH